MATNSKTVQRTLGIGVAALPNWRQREPDKPLCISNHGVMKLAWCPVCGQAEVFGPNRAFSWHLYDHDPEDFGLGERR